MTGILSTSSHIALIFNLSRSVGSPLFALACIAQPVITSLSSSSFWDKGMYFALSFPLAFFHGEIAAWTAYVTNDFHKRISSLKSFAKIDAYRQDIISSNLGTWIMTGTERQGTLPPSISYHALRVPQSC